MISGDNQVSGLLVVIFSLVVAGFVVVITERSWDRNPKNFEGRDDSPKQYAVSWSPYSKDYYCLVTERTPGSGSSPHIYVFSIMWNRDGLVPMCGTQYVCMTDGGPLAPERKVQFSWEPRKLHITFEKGHLSIPGVTCTLAYDEQKWTEDPIDPPAPDTLPDRFQPRRTQQLAAPSPAPR